MRHIWIKMLRCIVKLLGQCYTGAALGRYVSLYCQCY